MDAADIAQIINEKHLACALKKAVVSSSNISLENCAECDNAIPVARQIAVAGVQLCIDCQSAIENRR